MAEGSELNNFLSENGITLEGATASSTEVSDDDMPLVIGRRKTKKIRVEGKGWIDAPPGDVTPGLQTMDEETAETDTVRNARKSLYRKPPGELRDLQRRLWEGGFYDTSLSWEDIRQNDYDMDTEQAWDRAIKRAAAFYDADRELTVDEVIDMARLNQSEAEKAGKGRSGGAGRAPLTVQLTHPEDIRTAAMKISRNTLGRGWSEDQISRFVATYQSMERAAQTSQYGAAQGGGTTTREMSLESAVEAEARKGDPVAAGATDMVGAYDMILKAFQTLGGPTEAIGG